MPKNSEVLFPYRQVIALLRRAHTRYILPTLLIPILRFFLKSKNLKSLMISPKSHSTVTLTELMSKLYCSIISVRTPWRNGTCRSQRIGGSTLNINPLSSWGKGIPFQFLERIEIYQHACIVFFPLCIPKRIDKFRKLMKSYVTASFYGVLVNITYQLAHTYFQ